MSKQSWRKCIACRKVDKKEGLLRFVLNKDGEVSFDERHNAPGRGAYVHRDKECLKRALERPGHEKLWKYALKTGQVSGIEKQLSVEAVCSVEEVNTNNGG